MRNALICFIIAAMPDMVAFGRTKGCIIQDELRDVIAQNQNEKIRSLDLAKEKHGFERLSRKDVAAIKKGEPRYYFIDEHDTVWITNRPLKTKDFTLYVVEKDKTDQAIFVKEYGALVWDKTKKNFTFDEDYTIGLGEDEVNKVANKT